MFHLNLSGDPEGGWIGETHDGETHTTHHPEGATLLDALKHMLGVHFGEPPVQDDTASTASTASTGRGRGKKDAPAETSLTD